MVILHGKEAQLFLRNEYKIQLTPVGIYQTVREVLAKKHTVLLSGSKVYVL